VKGFQLHRNRQENIE